jgi:hypothetical protein
MSFNYDFITRKMQGCWNFWFYLFLLCLPTNNLPQRCCTGLWLLIASFSLQQPVKVWLRTKWTNRERTWKNDIELVECAGEQHSLFTPDLSVFISWTASTCRCLVVTRTCKDHEMWRSSSCRSLFVTIVSQFVQISQECVPVFDGIVRFLEQNQNDDPNLPNWSC